MVLGYRKILYNMMCQNLGVLVLLILFINIEAACLNGYVRHDNSCYHLSRDRETWISAVVACQLDGGSLVEIVTDRENSFVANLLINGKVSRAWIGGAELDVEGEWLWWNTKTPMTYTKWTPGEPNNTGLDGKSEECVEMINTALWNDSECDMQQKYICETPYEGGSEIVG